MQKHGNSHINTDDIMDGEWKNAGWLWNDNDCIDDGVCNSSESANFKQ